MAFYYELKALKVQAIRARNFEYLYIKAPGYSEYEADSETESG